MGRLIAGALALACALSPVQASDDIPRRRIASEFWSRAGWRDLRWGMGPTDVEERFHDPSASWLSNKSATADPTHGAIVAYQWDPELGATTSMKLSFGQAGLFSVQLEIERGLAWGPEEQTLLFNRVKRKLAGRLGSARCREFVDGQSCEWVMKQLRVQVNLFALAPDLVDQPSRWHYAVSVEYADPSAQNPQRSRLTKADAARRVDPRRWSAVGIGPIRLGMGLSDVVEAIRTSPCSVVCVRSDDTPVEIECEQKGCRATEQLDVSSLRFSGDGRLTSFSVQNTWLRDDQAALALFQSVSGDLSRMFASGRIERAHEWWTGEAAPFFSTCTLFRSFSGHLAISVHFRSEEKSPDQHPVRTPRVKTPKQPAATATKI